MLASDADPLQEIYLRAAALTDPAARAAFLQAACRDNEGLLQRVRALLQEHPDSSASPTDPLHASPVPKPIPELSRGERPGDQVGPYQLLQRLGEGAFGVVFAAQQIHPIRRDVAVKILKPGRDTGPIIARFERERQTLARLHHPHIACVHDAGSTPRGRPFFVMERVSGLPITRFCDDHRHSLRRRLALFVLVCRAVHHAHQKGILHRDLKPANILVGDGPDGPVPKVIDFGIAKALAPDADDAFTHAGDGPPGTPAYMSPEQAGLGQGDVDTRSDVYSLGAVLYELLVAIPAVDPRQCGTPEALRQCLRDSPWIRPSQRFRDRLLPERLEIASRRRVSPDELSTRVARDLDWVVGRAMEPDRERRYDSAESLARDVERYLAGEPVEAHPPAWRYRAAKFVVRRRALVASLALIALALVTGFAVAGWGLHTARREAQVARNEESKVRQLVDLMFDAFTRADPTGAGRRDYTVRELLDDLARSADAGEIESEAVECLVRDMLCFVDHQSGNFESARRHAERGLALARQLGDDPRLESTFHLRLGEILKNTGPGDAARNHMERAWSIHRRLDGPRHLSTLRVALLLARLRQRSGDDTGSRQLAEQCLAFARQQRGQPWYEDQLVRALHMVGFIHRHAGRFHESAMLAEERLSFVRRRQAENHPEWLHALSDLGIARFHQGRLTEADEFLSHALEGQRRQLGSDYPETLETMVALARVRAERAATQDANRLFSEALERSAHALGEDYPDRRRWLEQAEMFHRSRGAPASGPDEGNGTGE